jgi:DNA-binding MarR family transcriptional regulator
MARTSVDSDSSRARDDSSRRDPAADVETLLATCRLLVAISVRSLGAVDETVTLPELRVLVVLASRGTASLSRVAEDTGLHLSKASRMCDRLAKRELLTRRDDPDDRRTLQLGLTREGARLVERVQQARREALAPLVERMPAARRRQLVELMGELLAGDGVADHELWALGWVT